MKKFTLFLILSLFAFGLFAQNVTWQNLTATAELGRQGAFDFFDADRNITILGGSGPATINDEIISYTGADYYLQSVGTTAPYTLTTTAQNSIYSNILSERYIYTEALGSTYNANGCSGSQPFPIAMIYTNNGGAWAGVTSSAKPVNPAIVEFNNYIWQLGGSCYCSASTNYFNTISKSTDGVNFTTVSTTGVFSARDQTLPVVNNGSLYLFGGHYNAGSDVYYKDVYTSSNGADWSCLTRNAGFGNITNGGAAWSYNNLMYVYNADTASIYLSVSGTVWTTLTTINSFSPLARVWPVCQYVGNNQLFVIGGEYNTGTAYYANDSFYGMIDVSDLTATNTQTATPGQTTTITPTPTITVTPTNIPTSNITPVCPQIQLTVSAVDAANYGCIDSLGNFWVGAYSMSFIHEISPAGVLIHTYYGTHETEKFGQIVKVSSDGVNLWLGNACSTLTKFNPLTGTTIKQYGLYSATGGSTQCSDGGIQDIAYDGSFLWISMAESGGGASSGRIIKFNPVTEQVDLTITAQTNINGINLTHYGGQRYIIGACEGFWTKVNINTGLYSSYSTGIHSSGYRTTTDNVSVYVADYYSSVVKKYDLVTGSHILTWSVGSLLNSITSDGQYIYTVGDDSNVNVSNPNTGSLICTISGGGKSDIVYDGYNTLWTVLNGSVGVINITQPTATPTITPTFYVPPPTATATAIMTPFVQDLGQIKTTDGNSREIQVQKYPDYLNPSYVASYGATLQFRQFMTNDWSIDPSPDRNVFLLPDLKVSGNYPLQFQVQTTSPATTLNSNIITVSPLASPTP